MNEILQGAGSDKKREKVQLSPEAIEAFNDLKGALCEAPVLAIVDQEKPFRLETDASGKAIGAVLSQKQDDGRWHPVAYGSRTLNKAEQNYHSTKSEFLALKWAATEHFAEYLVGTKVPFEVLTDNNPLTYIMTSQNLDATGHRWVNSLAQCRFTLKYQKGKNNVVADALSRLQRDVSHEEVGCVLRAKGQDLPFPAEAARPCVQEVAEAASLQAKAAQVAPVDWGLVQAQDPAVQAVRAWIAGRRKEDLKPMLLAGGIPTEEAAKWHRERTHFKEQAGVLYREYRPPGAPDSVLQFVTPPQARAQAFTGCHDRAGHQGRERTLSLMQERFWWPTMMAEVTEKLSRCRRCIQHAARPVRAPLRPLVATAPLELVHVDFMSMETTTNTRAAPKHLNVLVVTDHFTRLAKAIVAKDQTAKTAAKLLYDEFFMTYGLPKRMVMDNALAFRGRVMSDLCARLGIEKSHSTPFHPQTNGQVERMNQTLHRMIGKLPAERKENWAEHLEELVHAYNCTRSAVTGFSPYYLMFGRRPRLPVDYLFPTLRGHAHAVTCEDWVAAIEGRLKAAFQAASKTSAAEALRQKRRYDRKARAVELRPGDQVLVRIGVVRGKRKIVDRWEPDAYRVIEEMSTPMVYRVRKDGPEGSGPDRILHRNNLFLLEEAEAPEQPEEPQPGPSGQVKVADARGPGEAPLGVVGWFGKLASYVAHIVDAARGRDLGGADGYGPPESWDSEMHDERGGGPDRAPREGAG